MSVSAFILVILGFVALTLGADLLVRAASRLAAALGISPLVIGLTVVAFGTSCPELAVSVRSAVLGQADIALGNVIGSNIFNVLLILGLSALVAPLIVSQQLIRLDVPVMIGVSLLLLGLALDGTISRLEGALLFAGIVGYTGFRIRATRRQAAAVVTQDEPTAAAAGLDDPTAAAGAGRAASWIRDIGLVIAGLALLVAGSRWLVDGAISFATAFGVSDLVIGLTIVAAGTSMPELATSVLATVRGERDIAVGNVVGSNIFNILAVLGSSALVAAHGIEVSEAALTFDLPVMIGVTIACLPIFFSGSKIARWEGALFVGYYVAYCTYLSIHAADHPMLPEFRVAMLYFAIPLTVVTLLVAVARGLRRSRNAPP